MNFKERLLSLDKKLVDMQYIDDTYVDSINDLFLTIETDTVTYSPCCYLDEDEYWVSILVLSADNTSQCLTLRKDSIVGFGFINTGSETFMEETIDIKDDVMYQ